jgi:hypothetical protein
MPSYRTREQYERWHVRDCARCGRRGGLTANWEGPVCRTCHDKAARTYGCCAVCGAGRLLPGRRDDGAAICRDCAGITRDFSCARCGEEALLLAGRLCERCTLEQQLMAVLDDGTGQVSPPMRALAGTVLSTVRPKSGLQWLRNPRVPGLLSGLATGAIPLTHEALHGLPDWRMVNYLRSLLMACGALPARDIHLLYAEAWLHRALAALAGDPHERVLRQYGTWRQLPRLRSRARQKPLTPAVRRFAGEQFTTARKFLGWLADRGRDLHGCTQADLDAWHAASPVHARNAARDFFGWAITARQMPKLTVPAAVPRRAAPMTQHRRITLLRAILTDEAPPLQDRVAACLMLLYAQPASRLVRLTAHDITRDDKGEVFIRLGDPPAPVPEPFASMLLRLAAGSAGAAASAEWLFPGRWPRHPANTTWLLERIRAMGIPAGSGRAAALRQLVLQAPAPVIAKALGYHNGTTTRILAEAGGTWTSYPARAPATSEGDPCPCSPSPAATTTSPASTWTPDTPAT